jgi:hypothetical protein
MNDHTYPVLIYAYPCFVTVVSAVFAVIIYTALSLM